MTDSEAEVGSGARADTGTGSGKRRHHHHHRHVKTEHKVQAVLRLLKGEDAGAVARDEDVSVERLERWQTQFIEGGRSALVTPKSKKGWFTGLAENFKGVGQWVGLFILLVLTVLILVRFMNHDGGQ